MVMLHLCVFVNVNVCFFNFFWGSVLFIGNYLGHKCEYFFHLSRSICSESTESIELKLYTFNLFELNESCGVMLGVSLKGQIRNEEIQK